MLVSVFATDGVCLGNNNDYKDYLDKDSIRLNILQVVD